ncbi:hypothetical protein B296_00025386 [Ensete ventricosum]|uniref:Uncharacterized protein n=1 Tax=Ensete ventricosum TaxID=4639 RepID=A0A427ARS3_ENSVE|nr:hypothetical protein B296_00025386 [Ensete ventricosum]
MLTHFTSSKTRFRLGPRNPPIHQMSRWDPSGRFHVGFIREGEAEGNPRLAARKPNPREKNGEAPDLLPLPSQKTAFPRQKSKVVVL